MGSIGRTHHLRCKLCGKRRPYWSDYCKTCRAKLEGMTKNPAKKYQAFCTVCLGGGKFLGRPSGKREAEREATSHMNMYGHHVTILEAR